MENIQKLLNEISKIAQTNKSKSDNGELNFFQIMFKGHEEETLHSRFISYLLSKDQKFLESFVRETLEFEKENIAFDTENCVIHPNFDDKSEYEKIDILIFNEEKKQAIIIENKIHANDSNHKPEKEIDGYKGQLERYYNTMITGLDKNLKRCKYQSSENETYVFYLSLYKKPSSMSIGEGILKSKFDFNKHIIKYQKIQEWLEKCVIITKNEISENKESLITIINQYKNHLIKMTNDEEFVINLTDKIAEKNNWKSAMSLFNNFIHIKWHTIHRFYSELIDELEIELIDKLENSGIPNNIDEVAHKNKKIKLIFEFKYKDSNLKIVNDEKGFTLVNLDNNKWGYFENPELQKIKFYEFTNEDTFSIIDTTNRTRIIDEIVNEVINHEKITTNDLTT